MARVELESSAQLLYRNPDFNTYGFLNVREDFAKKYPGYVKRVIEAYEKARKWTLENPEKVAEILAEEAQIDLEVAKLQLERNDFTESIPGNAHQKAIIEAGKILQQSEVIDKTVNIQEIATELIDSSIAESTIK